MKIAIYYLGLFFSGFIAVFLTIFALSGVFEPGLIIMWCLTILFYSLIRREKNLYRNTEHYQHIRTQLHKDTHKKLFEDRTK